MSTDDLICYRAKQALTGEQQEALIALCQQVQASDPRFVEVAVRCATIESVDLAREFEDTHSVITATVYSERLGENCFVYILWPHELLDIPGAAGMITRSFLESFEWAERERTHKDKGEAM
jgi:hypothetical protein